MAEGTEEDGEEAAKPYHDSELEEEDGEGVGEGVATVVDAAGPYPVVREANGEVPAGVIRREKVAGIGHERLASTGR